MNAENFLDNLAEGIAATMRNPEDTVRVIGDGHSGGLSIISREGRDFVTHVDERDICYGVLRPELDDFAAKIRQAHARRFAS